MQEHDIVTYDYFPANASGYIEGFGYSLICSMAGPDRTVEHGNRLVAGPEDALLTY